MEKYLKIVVLHCASADPRRIKSRREEVGAHQTFTPGVAWVFQILDLCERGLVAGGRVQMYRNDLLVSRVSDRVHPLIVANERRLGRFKFGNRQRFVRSERGVAVFFQVSRHYNLNASSGGVVVARRLGVRVPTDRNNIEMRYILVDQRSIIAVAAWFPRAFASLLFYYF